MAQVTELVTKFSFIGSLNPLKLFNADLAGGLLIMKEVVGGVAELGGALASFADEPLQAAKSLQVFSDTTGVSTERIQELRFAASVLGSEASTLDSAIASLSDRIGNAAIRGDESFARLGINVRDSNGHIKTADRVLGDVGRRFRELNLGVSERRTFAASLGIDPTLLGLLNQTGAQMGALRKRAQELGVITEKQADDATAYSNALTTLKFGLSGLQQQVSVGLAPDLTNLSNTLTDLIVENKTWIVEGLQDGAKWLGNLGAAMSRMQPVFELMGVGFTLMKIKALGFGKIMAFITSPMTLWVAGIAAALLIIDDLIVAFEGGNSVIRSFFMDMFGFDITPMLQDLVSDFTEGIDIIKGLFVDLADYVTGGFLDDVTGIGSSIADAVGGITDFLGITDADPVETISAQEYRSRTQGNTSNQVSQQNTFNITSTDPLLAGKSASDSVQRQMRNAKAQTNGGGF